MNVLGFCLSNFITLGCSGITTEAQWRLPLGIQMVFVAIILVMVYILPESPRWLLAHGHEGEAKHVLSMLNDHGIHEEFEEIRASIQAEQAAQASWSQMFEGGLGTRRVLLGMVLQLAQQLSGVNALGMHTSTYSFTSVDMKLTLSAVSLVPAKEGFTRGLFRTHSSFGLRSKAHTKDLPENYN